MDERVETARRLREDEGLTQKETAQRLGVAESTIRRWLDSEYAERQRQRSREAKRRRRVARCADCDALLAYDRQDNERCWICRTEVEYGAERREILAYWEQGLTVPEIAVRMGLSETQVHGRVQNARDRGEGVSLHRAQNRTDWDETERLFKAGLTYQAIADRLGCTQADISTRITTMRRVGIDLPRRNGASRG